LHAKLEVHAVAEEQLFYPLLAQEAHDEETAEGVHDHNEIRHAAAAVSKHEIDSEGWCAAVRNTRQVNADHMVEEEVDFFPSFKEAVDDEQREALGVALTGLPRRARAGFRAVRRGRGLSRGGRDGGARGRAVLRAGDSASANSCAAARTAR
jgi:hypothetical protein